MTKPSKIHRNIVKHVETPGTLLNEAWADLDAPPIAVGYWRLPPGERTWLDTLKRMLADEAHHRDINHTLASLPTGAENPFIERFVIFFWFMFDITNRRAFRAGEN